MLGPDREATLSSHAEALNECLRSSLACQLSCIACADEGLGMVGSRPLSSLVRTCLACLEACMWLSQAVLFGRPEALDLSACLRICADACATCEAECLASQSREPRVRRCLLACAQLRERCRKALDSAAVESLRLG